ncbi:MAG: SIMPL domain-containing protein [Lachnospiraceae bacterium]|nr:SIMPL domain-containing protein [Lachnospiraceae bacterium]
MKKRYVLAIISMLTLGSVALSGCSSKITAAEPIQASENRTVSVESSETVEIVPDMAQLTYGIRTENEDAVRCQQENTEKLNALLEYLKGLGFSEESIRTSDFSLDPRYDWSGNTQLLVGYEMNTQVTVTDVALEKVGSMLSDGVAAGANEIRSVSYFSSEYDKAYHSALEKAVELAREKAGALAAAGDSALGPVLNIEEYGDAQYGRYINSGMNTAAGSEGSRFAAKEDLADMGVMPGKMQVTANIRVEFELSQP